MPTHNHFPNLINAFNTEWLTLPAVLVTFRIYHDGNRYWTVEDGAGRRVSTWECRPFPGCSALITTTQFQVYDGYREQGIGRALRELQHKAYKRAGFSGEIATVRADNVAMQAFMSGRVIDEFPSDFGGTFKLWLTRLDTPVVQAPRPVFAPPPAPRVPYTYDNTPPPLRTTINAPTRVEFTYPPPPRVTMPPYVTPPPQAMTQWPPPVAPAAPPPEANRAEPGENPGTQKKEKLYAHWPD